LVGCVGEDYCDFEGVFGEEGGEVVEGDTWQIRGLKRRLKALVVCGGYTVEWHMRYSAGMDCVSCVEHNRTGKVLFDESAAGNHFRGKKNAYIGSRNAVWDFYLLHTYKRA
jgi:hypothetical protein